MDILIIIVIIQMSNRVIHNQKKTMAKVVDLNIDPALEDQMLKSIKIKRRYYDPSIDKKTIVWRKRNLKAFAAQSDFNPVAIFWENLSQTQKDLWSAAAAHCGLTGYQLYTQDKGYRIQNNISGNVIPDVHHQFMILDFLTEETAEEFYFGQDHYSPYYVLTKNVGQKNAYTPVYTEEEFAPPLLLEFDYKSDIIDVLEGEAYFYYDLWFSGIKDGSPAGDAFINDLPKQQDWTRFSEEFEPDLDLVTDYGFTIIGEGVRGQVQIDNVNFEHDGQNFAFDKNCNDVNAAIVYDVFGWEPAWWFDPYDVAHAGSIYLG